MLKEERNKLLTNQEDKMMTAENKESDKVMTEQSNNKEMIIRKTMRSEDSSKF